MAIGTSTGGIAALHEIFPEFPKSDSYAILIAMHIISPKVVDNLAKRLNEMSSLEVKMANQGMLIEPGTAYFMPCDYHAETKREGGDVVINLHKGPKVHFVRPSIDVFMASVADVFKENTIGVLLTGMGMDGAQGIKAVKDAGGSTMVQDSDTSSVFQMPEAAIDLRCVDTVLPLEFIPKKTIYWINEKISNWEHAK